MQFQQAVATVFRKYAVFTGRASRSEYWYFVLFNVVVSAVFSFLGLLFGGSDGPAGWVMVLSYIYGLATLLPGLGVSVRRMHDIGKGGRLDIHQPRAADRNHLVHCPGGHSRRAGSQPLRRPRGLKRNDIDHSIDT